MATPNLIPFFGIDRQYQSLRTELLDVTDRVYSSGQVLDGHYVTDFEAAIAKRCNRRYAIAVNSCSQGLWFAQLALGLKSNNILIPAISFVATLNSVLLASNTPTFCDVAFNGLMDLGDIDLQTKDIDAIMYVNIFGNVLDYDKLDNVRKFWCPNKDIAVIEDAAQSFGASYKGRPSGSLGDISVLSFDPTKNLPNYGSGGMILTDDANIAEFCCDIRNNAKHEFSMLGTNSRMSEADCAQMLVKLNHFDAWQQRRAAIADYYIDTLFNYMDIALPNTNVVHAWHKFVIYTPSRNQFQLYLAGRNIETRVHYERPLYEHEAAFNYINYASDFYPGAREHSHTALSLPIYPELTDSEVEYVASTIKQHYTEY